jgi:DNA-binding CsgD family transcriptional regulator
LSITETGSGIELSEREREILRLVATGASNKDIARQLTISPNTVKVHLRNIFAKIGSASRTEATLYAIRAGLAAMPGTATTSAETAEPSPEARPGPAPGSNGLQLEPTPAILPTIGKAGPSIISGKTTWRAWRYAIGLGAVAIVLALASLWAARQPGANRAATSPVATSAPLATPVRWTTKAPLPTGRSGLAAAVYENLVYAIGGETDQGITGIVERYDPNVDTWATLTPKPIAVADVSAAVIGGLIYVPGGRLPSGQATNQFEAYDPRHDQWTERAPLPLALSGYSLAAFEGKLYLFGGWDGAQYVAKTFEYSPDTDRWVEKRPMPTARGFAGAAATSSRIYVIGGEDGQKSLGVNEAYTPEQDLPNSNPWQTDPPLPAARSHMGVASIVGIIHVLGGQQDDQTLTYDEHSGAWLTVPGPDKQMATDASVAVLGTEIEVVGGKLAARTSTQHLQYQAIFVITLPAVVP